MPVNDTANWPPAPYLFLASSNVASSASALQQGKGRLKADGGKIYVIIGDSAVAAPVIGTNCWPIADGETLEIFVPKDRYIRTIMSAGSGTLLATVG